MMAKMSERIVYVWSWEESSNIFFNLYGNISAEKNSRFAPVWIDQSVGKNGQEFEILLELLGR
jgi:hypothetical protein